MKKIVFVLFLIGALQSCKEKTPGSECEDRICTEEFRALVIKFTDNKAAGAEVKDFSVVNQRTGEKIKVNSAATSNSIKGNYIIVTDQNVKELSEEGDDLKVTGTSVETNQTKSILVKVKGGRCACHIAKVSGPEQIIFD